VNRPFARQKVEGGEFEVVEGTNRPAILAIRLNVTINSRQPIIDSLGELFKTVDTPLRPKEDLLLSGKRPYGGISDWRVLLLQKVLCLVRPRHQLAIEAYPIGLELLPQTDLLHRLAQPGKTLSLQRIVCKKPSAGARVDDTSRRLHYTKAFLRDAVFFAQHYYGARAHVLLLTDHRLDAFFPVELESLVRMLQ
jgi:hypothetical protein